MKMEHCNWPQFTTGVIIGVKFHSYSNFILKHRLLRDFMAVRKRYRFEEMCSKTNWCKCRSVSAFAIFQKINFCPDCVWIKSRVKERCWWSWLVLLSCLSLSLSVSHTHSLSNTHTRAHTLSLNFEPWSVAFVGKVHIRNRCSQAPAPDVDGNSLWQITLQDYFFTLFCLCDETLIRWLWLILQPGTIIIFLQLFNRSRFCIFCALVRFTPTIRSTKTLPHWLGLRFRRCVERLKSTNRTKYDWIDSKQ